MKNSAKKYLVIILAVALLLSATGCKSALEATEAPEETQKALTLSPYWTEDTPDEIVFTECQFYGDTQYNVAYKEAWPKAIEERYGLSVVVQYPPREGYMETLEASVQSGDLTGLVEIFGGPYLLEWKNNGWIHPLSEYLAENDVWNNLIPDYWKEANTYNGEIWAIPTGSDGSATWFTRSIRGDWLEYFDMEKPYTIDEFYEASHAFTYKDPDQNGYDDTMGFTSVGTWNIQDIFQAFDARLNHVADPVPVWNPNTNVWEDSMIKPEMAECLVFLRKCYSEKIMDQKTFAGMTGEQMRNTVSEGYCGGTFYWDSWTLSFDSRVKSVDQKAFMLCVGALSGNIDKNLNHYGVGMGAPRVMMKNTKQPSETINWYVNTFFGDEWGYWTGRIGPVGETRGEAGAACTIEGNTVVRNTYIDSGGNFRFHPTPGFIGGLPSRALYSEYEVEHDIPSNQKYGEELAKRLYENFNLKKEWIDEYIANGMAYMLPEKLKESTSEKYLAINNQIVEIATEAIRTAVTGIVSVDDALAKYRSEAKILGVKDILDFENEKLGKKTGQSY